MPSGLGTVFQFTPGGTNFILTNRVVFTTGNGAVPEGTLPNGGGHTAPSRRGRAERSSTVQLWLGGLPA
jgi:hypothetical protein